jgi:hypothetical protein
MTMTTRQFIDQLAAGESSAARDTLENVLSARAFETLDDYKKQIAANIFGGEESKQEEAQTEE